MPFEFAFLDWLLQFHTPTMDALAVFFNYADAHGEIWIALTLILLFSRRTRRAGLAMALALGLYMITGHFLLKPLFARPRPNGYSFPSGHTSSAFAAAWALFRNDRQLGIPALVLAAFIGFTRLYLYVHFPTDVLGGIVFGIVLGILGDLLADKLAKFCKKKQIV